ncbi:MAG: transglycosylase domain-containing protein [bacterium]|nr:transglycosylase domain-containing protein [bacterium]
MGFLWRKKQEATKELADLAKSFWMIRKRPWVSKTIALCLALFLVGVGALFFYLYHYAGGLNDSKGNPIDWEKLNKPPRSASYVYSASGERIGMFFYEIRDPAKLSEVPDLLKKGFIAAEDQRFYSHHGIDIRAIIRAFIIDQLHKAGLKYGPKQGASTVSQQVVRLRYGDDITEFRTREYSYRRKLKEARIAIQLEKRYSKEKIMEVYLNSIYFGHGMNGVVEAARFYFGKDLRKVPLSPREVAILVSLNKSSRKYDPIFHRPPKPVLKQAATEQEVQAQTKIYDETLAKELKRITFARDRFNWVLERMCDEKFVTQAQYEKALFRDDELEIAELHITPVRSHGFGYGTRIVKDTLLISGFSESAISLNGGLHITTSYDENIQTIAEEELTKQFEDVNRERKAGEDKLEFATVVIENKTGRVVALTGGHDFEETQYNRVLSLRSAGSVFKPFTYAAAFEFYGKGFHDTICNCPFKMPGKISIKGKVLEWWSPKNFKEENPVPLGAIPLPTGLIRSVNLATLNLAREVGISRVIEVAHKTGVWGERNIAKDPSGRIWFRRPGAKEGGDGLVPRLPTAIGASDASLLELTSAFSVFARGGVYLEPVIILEVKDSDGNIVYKAEAKKPERVLSEGTAKKVTILLRAVTKIGTAKISMRGIGQQVAVKTGTSNGPNDLSMIGFTPEYTIGIRFGYDNPKAIEIPEYMKRVSGDRKMQVSGGWVAGPVWRRIVDRMYKERKKQEFSPDIEEGLKEILDTFD